MEVRGHRHWYQKKRFIIPLFVVLLIVGASFVLEPLALKKANEVAATANPEFKGHIDDLDISLFKGAIELEGVTATLKKNGREFLKIDDVAVDLDWKRLFQGQILLDVVIDHFNVLFKNDIVEAAKRLPKAEKKEMKTNFKVAEILIRDSKVTMLDYMGLEKDKHFEIKKIHGAIRNLTQKKNTELATYDIGATLTGKDMIKLTGNLDIASEPPRWDVNAKLKDFHLTSTNKDLRKLLPLDYKHGTVDIYSEAKSENGKIYGYVKPFLNDVVYTGNSDEYKNAKHFILEVVGSFANWTLENHKKESVATRVPFIYKDGAFSVESGEAIKDAVEHGLLENKLVHRGIEKKYKLNAPNPKEVQAQEDDLKEKIKEKKEDKKEDKKD
jgi:hypothetical protein